MKSIETSHSEEKKLDFDFTAAEVLKALKPSSPSTPIEYIGSATSHFQSEPILYDNEGNLLPPMTDWELELHKNLADTSSHIKDDQGLEHLPKLLREKEKYVGRSTELGENMFRFSLDFGRLCPKSGEFNTELMAEYIKALALIRANGQQPMLTLHHFTMPRFLVETDADENITRGGWENPDVSRHFRFYIENVIRFLADDDKIRAILRSENIEKAAQDQLLSEGLVKYFMTFNEPAITPLNGYITGIFPPFRRGNVLPIKKILERMIEAHDIAFTEIKNSGKTKESEVGIGYSWQYFDGVFGKALHSVANEYMTDVFERDGAYSDFLGLHYYYRMTTPRITKRREGRDYGDHPGFGDIYPSGILEMLKRMNAAYPTKEIFISEIGFADAADKRKPYWLIETVRYIIEAKKIGVPIKGMLLWSLVNNFEWDLGMNGAEFGLFSEAELDKPLIPSTNGIRSWEVWKATTKAITSPSPESLAELQSVYERAKSQYDMLVL